MSKIAFPPNMLLSAVQLSSEPSVSSYMYITALDSDVSQIFFSKDGKEIEERERGQRGMSIQVDSYPILPMNQCP